MRPRADRGAAFVPGPPFVGATRRGEGRAGGRGLLAARRPAPLRPPRRRSRRSLQEFVGSTLAPPRGRSRGAGGGRPEGGGDSALGPGAEAASGSAGLRGRSWRAPRRRPPSPTPRRAESRSERGLRPPEASSSLRASSRGWGGRAGTAAFWYLLGSQKTSSYECCGGF